MNKNLKLLINNFTYEVELVEKTHHKLEVRMIVLLAEPMIRKNKNIYM